MKRNEKSSDKVFVEFHARTGLHAVVREFANGRGFEVLLSTPCVDTARRMVARLSK